MKITQWLKSLVHTEQREMPDMKDIVTDDIAVKTQIKSTLDQQIDAAVDTALTDILGSDADNTVMQ
ncbi:hypothetical protein AII36_09365 [Salmonella enterica]|nr:hypothetical protein [Salmonella enterica]